MGESAPLVDLHCHILPGLDDGARDVDDALAMARQAWRDGIGAICATPHIRHDHDVRISELPERRSELEARLSETGSPLRVLAGGEVAVTAVDGLDDDELRAVSLGGAGRWVLLEPAPGPLDERLPAAAARLHARGFRAVIAHPERHLAEDLLPTLAQAVNQGALIQATAAYFSDPAARQGMLDLALVGAVHAIATDAHSSRLGRPVILSQALEALRGVETLAPRVGWMSVTAPAAIIAGHDLAPPFPLLTSLP